MQTVLELKNSARTIAPASFPVPVMNIAAPAEPPPQTEAVLEIRDLSVVYRASGRGQADRQAVKNLTLKVRRGEVFGFLGPNGAGKTTTMNVLLGFVNATG